MFELSLIDRAETARELAKILPGSSNPPPRAIVAIPVRDEEDRIGACIEALTIQRDLSGRPLAGGTLGIVLLLNNCADRTAGIARTRLAASGLPFCIADVVLPPAQANAGFARGLALDLAALWLEREGRHDGVLLTTDADSRVAPHWVARNLAGIERGCGGVAGTVALEPAEAALLPPGLVRRGAREGAYEQALLALSARIDPLAHDPWPNHWAASGASFGVTLEAYRAIGGLAPVASGEDRALGDALLRRDIRIRHDPEIVVITSARLEGRARGGVADTMRLRCEDPEVPGDDNLEALPNALHRYLWRRRLRRWHGAGLLRRRPWKTLLGLPKGSEAWAEEPAFGAFWAGVEAASPRLTRVPLRPRQMPPNTDVARALLAVLGAPGLRETRGNRADSFASGRAEPAERILPAQ